MDNTCDVPGHWMNWIKRMILGFSMTIHLDLDSLIFLVISFIWLLRFLIEKERKGKMLELVLSLRFLLKIYDFKLRVIA